MNNKFFNNKLFFGVFVVFVVVCLFLVFFRVVHAQSAVVPRSSVEGVRQVGELVPYVSPVQDDEAVPSVRQVVDWHKCASVQMVEVLHHLVGVDVGTVVGVYPMIVNDPTAHHSNVAVPGLVEVHV